MDAEQVKDKLGNVLAVGDTVATAMVARSAGQVVTGEVVYLGGGSARVQTERGALIWRVGGQLVKAVRA